MATQVSNHSTPARVWFITGASSGFGKALAEAVLARGERVVGLARALDPMRDLVTRYPEQTQLLKLDVTDPTAVTACVAEAIARWGRIDVLVNNAGFGLLGGIEEASDAEVRSCFDVNVFGVLHVLRAVLPQLRAQRAGHILNISSVGGVTASPGWGNYNASKFALEGISESLAQEVAQFNIRVTIVEPGYFRTDFLGGHMRATRQEIPDYAATVGQMRTRAATVHGLQAGDPVRAAAAMIAAVDAQNPPLRLVLGADALERIRNKLTAVGKELDVWQATTVSTAFDSGTA